MQLADEREFAVGHAFDEMKLPQWAVAIQRGAGDVTDDLVEFSPAAGGAHLYPPQVVVEVNLAVFQPHRVMQSPRNVDELVAQRIQPMQPAQQRVPEQLESELVLGSVDDRDLERVRMQVRALGVQQHRIHAVEPLHSTIIAAPTSCGEQTSGSANGRLVGKSHPGPEPPRHPVAQPLGRQSRQDPESKET